MFSTIAKKLKRIVSGKKDSNESVNKENIKEERRRDNSEDSTLGESTLGESTLGEATLKGEIQNTTIDVSSVLTEQRKEKEVYNDTSIEFNISKGMEDAKEENKDMYSTYQSGGHEEYREVGDKKEVEAEEEKGNGSTGIQMKVIENEEVTRDADVTEGAKEDCTKSIKDEKNDNKKEGEQDEYENENEDDDDDSEYGPAPPPVQEPEMEAKLKEEVEEYEHSESDYGEAAMDTDDDQPILNEYTELQKVATEKGTMNVTTLDHYNKTSINQSNNHNNPIAEKKVDPRSYNKFKNDGSFLALAMTMLQNKKRSHSKKANVNVKRKKKKKVSVEAESKNEKNKTAEGKEEEEEEGEEEEEEEEEEVVLRRKKEFLDTLKNMEEQGLFTDRGIGTGLVK